MNEQTLKLRNEKILLPLPPLPSCTSFSLSNPFSLGSCPAPHLGFDSRPDPGGVLEVRIVVQSHLNGMSCQCESTESKGPSREAKLGHQVQGDKLRIKTKPQPHQGGELD